MYITCKCLNVSIKTKGEILNTNVDDVDLGIKEQAEAFFNNSIAIVQDLDTIKNELPGLVEVKKLGSWDVHRCCNCLTYTHAVHRDYGTALVMVNTRIITSEEEINHLKACADYSPVFRIVIDRNKVEESELEPQTKFPVSHLPSSSRLALATLEQQLEEAICQQAHLIDTKIREFTRQQYQVLDKFKERAHSEHHFLTRLIRSEKNTVDDSSAPMNQASLINDVVDATAIPQNNDQHPSNNKSPPHSIHINGSRKKDVNNYDGEPLFLLEGMDDNPSTNRITQISDQESDTDDSGNEAIHLSRNHRGGHPTLAKSLPVTVPAFHSFSQRLMQDDDDEQISRDPMDPHNIQASIKALAKSVHGDTVFGDLPRPRFSTQI